MPSKEFLLQQIARAKRFAAAMNSNDDKEKVQKIAADYQGQLDAAETAASTTAATETAPSEAAASPNEAVAAPNETGPSAAVAPQQAAASTDDQEPTTD